MFTKSTIAGAAALLAAPIVVIIATLAQPTLSGDAAKQVAALTDHRGAMITGMALNFAGVVLLIAGVIWLALTLAPRAPRLAMAGGVLGVFGLLVVLFENSVAAAFPAIVGGLDRIQATFVLDRIHSGAISALEPLSVAGDIGLALLGIAAVKAGAPRWAGAAIVVGALGEGVGFATGTRALVIISFALLFAGLLPAVRTLGTSPRPVLAAAGAETGGGLLSTGGGTPALASASGPARASGCADGQGLAAAALLIAAGRAAAHQVSGLPRVSAETRGQPTGSGVSADNGRVIEVDPGRFEEMVVVALDSLPEDLGRLMRNVAVTVEHDVGPPGLLGLYEGIPLTSRTTNYAGVLPDRITIYRVAICRICRTEEEVVDQVRRTVIHEVGHHFGIDDDRLEELGW